jgi:hypothetical protein
MGRYLASLIFSALLLSGCGPQAPLALGAAVVVSGASIPIFHRTPVDMLVSAASGRDCSVVNLDRGEWYCLPREQLPGTPEFCTRSLGVPDCWEDPSKVPGHPRGIADGPRTLTPDQDKDRTRWFGRW